MDWPQRIAPLDPVAFRDACLALWTWCDEKHDELGDDFRFELAMPMFFMDYYQTEEGGEEERSLYERSAMRVLQFEKLCRLHDVDFAEVVRETEDPKVLEVHMAVLEAMAVVPFNENGIDLQDLLAEARARAGEIDALERLFSLGAN